MSSSSSSRSFRVAAAVLGLALVIFLCWRLRPREPVPAPPPAEPSAAAAPAPHPVAATDVTPAAASRTPAADSASSPVTGRPVASAAPGTEIARTIRENAVPGRILFLDFTLDDSGLRLVGATGAAGRAKPSGRRPGFGFIHYEVFDAGGQVTAEGSVEDPTRRRVEFPASSNDGRIASTIITSPGGPLAVRLPGESSPHRIVFFRDQNPAAPSAAGRERLAEFLLQPTP